MTTNERFSVVRGRGKVASLEALCYGHSTIIFSNEAPPTNGVGVLCAIVRTAVEGEGNPDYQVKTPDVTRVDYLAAYQCGRFGSALWGVQGTYERLSEALTALAEIVAYEQERTSGANA